MIKIGGSEYPLVFSHDAIASIEAEFDQSILDVQERIARADVRLAMLMAASGQDKAVCTGSEMPPITEVISLIQRALHVAYFGADATQEVIDNDEAPPKKKPRSRSKAR